MNKKEILTKRFDKHEKHYIEIKEKNFIFSFNDENSKI